MRRHLAIVALTGLGLLLQGCANAGYTNPSYLGFAAAGEDEDEDGHPVPAATAPPQAARHVSSNKVLGAMAFQKVTGRAVDPERLSSGN